MYTLLRYFKVLETYSNSMFMEVAKASQQKIYGEDCN